MTPEPRTIASQILIALDHDYAGMPECDDHAGKAWHKLFRKADELGLLDDDLLEAMMQERLAHLDDPNLRLMRLDADASAALESAPCTLEVRGDAAVLTVGNLDSTEAADLLTEHADQVRAAKKLVIDMRDCTGGVEQAAYPLLDWLFDEPTTLETLIGTQQVLTNYSTGACKARIAQFTQLKALIEAQGAGDTTAWLDQGLRAAQESMGKGFVEESLAPAQLDIAMINKFYDLAAMQPEVPATVRSHYELLEHTASACIGCRACETRCPFGVPVAERMRKTAALFGC